MSDRDGSMIMGKPPFLALCHGMKRSGKSVLIRHICWQYRNEFSYVVVFSGSEEMNGAYDSYLPKKYIHSSYDSSVMNAIIEKQKKFKQANKDIQCLVIFDDAMTFNWHSKKENPELVALATSNRHMGISIIIAIQSPRLIPNFWRSNADYVFLFRHLNQAVEDLYAQLSPMPKKNWQVFYNKHTSDWKIIMFCTHAQHNDELLTVFSVPKEFMTLKFRLAY